tara:strand:+ start:7103 stop:7471 length:369 start_codon:yes stop_codon:yes gene_type:complete
MSIDSALEAIGAFQGESLTRTLSEIEAKAVGLTTVSARDFAGARGITGSFMCSAASIKAVAGQINVIIHAAGILCALPHILVEGEKVEETSLGAGNTGKRFDITTNKRVAEFKFIDWRGGSE